MRPKTLDHVAYWVADRDSLSDFVTEHLGMHVIDRTDKFTLVGANARRGKLTFFTAEGPRKRGALKHVALRVSDLDETLRGLPADLPVERGAGEAFLDAGQDVQLGLVQAETDLDYDLDHVALYSASPEETAAEWQRLGFRLADPGASGAPRVEVGGAYVEFHEGDPGQPEKPLLNHVAVLVDSAEEHRAEAKEVGVDVEDFVDAPNTIAVFLRAPERVRVEYVEHKPTFSLA